MKKYLRMIMLALMVLALALLGACGGGSDQAAEETADTAETAEDAAPETVDGSAYGYDGNDAVEAAVYKYLAETVSKDYDAADASVPVVTIIGTDTGNEDDILVWGDFWINNYNVEGDTLKCVSGGSYPGVMHLAKSGDACEVKSFDVVEDGGNFDSSAKELFGDKYDDFVKISSDDKQREETRADILAVYVKANGLDVTKYQDEGWDPVDIPL